jgi:hypothetical protein
MDAKEPPKFGGSFVPASRALALVMRWLHLGERADAELAKSNRKRESFSERCR